MEQTSSIKLVKILVAFLSIFLVLYVLRYATVNKKNKPSLTFSTQKLTHTQSIEAGNTAYTTYRITVPKRWTVTRDSKNEMYDILTVVKDLYRLEIQQKKNPEMLSCDIIFTSSSDLLNDSNNPKFIEIKGSDNKMYRRSMLAPNPKALKSTDTICEKNNKGYILPTTFGTINYDAPINSDPLVLKEMDTMIQSLQQID